MSSGSTGDACGKFTACRECLLDAACTFCDTGAGASAAAAPCFDATLRPGHCAAGEPVVTADGCPAETTSGGVGSVVGVILGCVHMDEVGLCC
jgi:hypothetical protein